MSRACRILAALCLTLLVAGWIVASVISASPPVSLRRIVVFDPVVSVDEQLTVVEEAGGRAPRPLGLINAVAVVLPDAAAERALTARFDVVRVDEDIVIEAHGQEIPWGIGRIEAPAAWAASTGSAVKVAILDTGIQRDHPDLGVSGGYCAISNSDAWDDDNGHRTHVAGTVAALNNGIGVVGVAYDVALYAVKVLDDRGSGYFSDLVVGLQWCIDNDIEILNMSLGASSGNDSFHEAIQAVYDRGIVLVASAGNSGPRPNSVGYPAKYPETIAVAATDSDDGIARWSSRGSEVDIAAPGVSVRSTWNDGDYRTASGTSMAAPHVAGVAALVLAAGGPAGTDGVRALLTETAEDLGHASTAQGAGLVRADRAVDVDADPPATGGIHGTVTSVEGVGIEGATVAVEGTGYSAETGSDGNYEITEIPVGTYNVTASKVGYTSETSSVEVVESETLLLDFTLALDEVAPGLFTVRVETDRETYSSNSWVRITVTVTDDLGNGVAGAGVTVTVTEPDGGDSTAVDGTTDRNGVAQFRYRVTRSHPVGKYHVYALAEKDGYMEDGETTFIVE